MHNLAIAIRMLLKAPFVTSVASSRLALSIVGVWQLFSDPRTG